MLNGRFILYTCVSFHIAFLAGANENSFAKVCQGYCRIDPSTFRTGLVAFSGSILQGLP